MPAPSGPKKRGRPRKPQITLNRSPVVAPAPLPNALAGRGFAFTPASLALPTILASEASEASSLTVVSANTIVMEEVKSPPAAAPPTIRQISMMPFSPQKRHINLIIRDSAKVPPTPRKAPTSRDTTETDEAFAGQVQKSNTHSGRPTTAGGASKTTTPMTSSHLTSIVQNESSLNPLPVPPRPISIADAVRNISTDSEPSSSSSSEDDTDADETFHPKRNWAAVNTGSSAGAPRATSRGGGSVGTRGRGRGRGSTPVGGGNAGVRPKSATVKIEKGQLTLGSFFLKSEQPPMPAAGIGSAGPVAKRGCKRGTGAVRVKLENEDEDVDMKDA